MNLRILYRAASTCIAIRGWVRIIRICKARIYIKASKKSFIDVGYGGIRFPNNSIFLWMPRVAFWYFVSFEIAILFFNGAKVFECF